MNLGELIVDLSLDYAEFTQSLEQAKTAAFSAAASIEKSFQKISLSVDIDDKPLTDLNQHLNISVQHLKQANIFFKNNPITTYVNDDSLTDLNQHLDSKVRHLKEVNKFYAQNPITVRTNTSQLDELEERLDRLGNRKVTMEVDTIVLSQYQDKTAEVVERAIANAVREMQVPQSSGQSAQQSQPQQQNRVQRVQMGLDPLRSIGEGVFENVGKQLSKGIGSSTQDSLGVDIKSFTQIASNSVLRYFGVGKKAQKDPKNNKSKIKSIVEDAIKDYVSAVDKGSGSIRGELDDVDLSSVDAIAKNSLLRYFGVGKKAQSDPKNNRAKIKSIIEDAVQQYSGTEVKKENSGVISSTLSEINKAFSEAVNESVQEIAERAKAATIKKVRRASTNVLANSSSGVRDRVNSLLDAAESGKKGSIGQYIGRGLASQSRKAVEGTFSNLFPTVAPIVKEFLSTGNKPPVEKQAPKQRPADGLLEAANQLKEAAKAISESAIKVQSVAPVIHEQIADPWGSADLTPVQVPLKPAKQKTKKDEPEPELVLLEFPQQTQQHFRTLNAEVGKNTAKSLEFLKATTQENIKQQTTQSIANIKAALTAISQYFRSEYKQVKDAVDNAKATGHIDDINAARSAAKNYQRRSSGAIKEIDRIVKSGEDAGFNKEFGSELSQVHATGKGQLVASDKRVGQQLGGLNLLETNQFKKDVKLYTELAKKAGIEIDAGLIKGLDIGSAEVSAEARDLLNGLIATVKKTMGIQSPSRVMMAIGAMIAAGLVIGVKNGVVDVSSAVRLLTDNINKGMKEIDLSPVNPIETFNDAVQQSIPVKFDPQKLLGLTNDLANNVISAVANSIRQTRMSGNATLGQFMRNAVVAAGTAMSGSLMGALGGPLKTFFPMVMKVVSSLFPMIMKVALPMAGVAALKLGDATTGNLLKNGIFKQGGFLTELLSAFSGIKLGSMGGAEIKSAITGITEFLGVFPMLTPLAAIGTMSANAGVTAHDVFAGGSGEGRTVNTVLGEKTAKNLKQAGVNSTGNSTADLVENLAETTVGALFRMIGFDGVKASAVQALIKGKVKKHSGEIAKSVGGVGKGQLSALIDGYVKGDSTQLAGTAESMLKNMGITGLDPKQVKLAANAITATLSGLHAKFGQEGFNLGNSINKGFKDSMKNLANVKDDVEYNIKKALGKATAGDVIGNILKRMSRGFVVDKGMFDEMWNQVGSAFKKGAFKGMGGDEQEGMFGNMMGFMASASAMLAPITTMAASLAPLFLPLMPIIAGIGGAIRMVMPQLSKLFDGIQRVEALQRRFTFLGGSKAGGIAELNYAKGVANQMNVSSEVSANAYSQLAIAAKGTKMEGQGVKDLFEGITASLSALGISGQDASLVFMAYTQIMAKGKLSMEELRQQLGEKFPPAMGVFAKAMGVSVSELNDLIASGSILSQDILPKVAKVLNLDYGKSASGSADSLVLALTKLGNVGFEITSIFTDKLSGALAGVVNFASNGLGFLKDSLGTLIPLGQSFAIGFAATIAVGLSIMMTKIKPVVVLLGTLQSLVLSTFSAIASNLMPMIIGITSDVADGWLGAESDLMKNMYDGVNNMIVGLFSMVDSGARALSGKPLFAEGLIGGKGVNLVVAGIDAIKGALSAVFSVIPPGVVELGALVFMFEQAIALGSMALGPALVGGGKALLGMVVGIKDAFVGTVGTVKIWGELMMTSMSKAADVTDISAKRATIALAGWQLSMSVLRSMVTHVAIAMAILMFSKGDFSNPLGDKISETSKKVTVNLNNMKSAALSLGEAFDKAAGQLVNLNNKLTDTLPSKGAQLDIRNFWDKTKSTTSDDLTRNSNRAEIERRQREKDGKQTFGDRLTGFNQFTRNLTSFGLSGWSNDRLVPKTDDATIDLVKKYGLEKYIAPDKNLRIDMAQSQVIKALQDSEANIKVLNKKLAEIGLTKETQQNYLIPEKMGPVGNTFDIDARIKAANDKIARIDELDKKYTFYKGGRVDGRISKEENLSGFSFGGKTANPERIIRDDLDIEKNIIREKIKELENQRAIISQGVERFKSNKEIQLIDAQILDKVKRGVQLEKANPSDAVRKELGGIDAAVLELKTRREKIINGMGSDVKDNQEALDLLVQHKKDILDGADEATKAYSTQIRRVIANNVDPQIELVKNALEIAQKSVPAQLGDDLYQKAANKLRDTQIAFDRTGSADRIASLNFSASVNGSSERPANITPILANRQVADLEKQQKELDNLTKVKKETIDAYAAILRYGANKDVKDELEKLKADVLKDDESLAQLRNDIVTAKRGIRQALIDQTKQVADYYRTAVREAQAVSIEFQKAQKTLENSRMQNKLREALIGAGDNIYTQFIEGIINIISQTSEIEKQQLEAKKQRIDYENNVQDIRLQAAELQRSLPGRIIPLDSSIADNFNLSLEKIDGTVVTINDEVKDVANSLSKDVVDAAKKANAELDKLNQSVQELDKTSNSWIDGFGSKFAGLFDVFKNGFDGIGGKINELQVQTATWLGSIGNAPSLFQNVQSAVTGVFEKRAGQQLEQVATDPLGAINSFLGAKDKILSPIQGTTIEDLLRYKPSYQQSFYGSRDEGARQHSKVDFDGRVKAGRNAEIIASLPGTATARKWTGNSGGVFIDSILPSGQKITLEYGHLSLESIKKTFGGQLGKSIEVQAGQKLGNVIQDALSKGPHLDFGVRLNGKYIDPQEFLQDFMGGKYQATQAAKPITQQKVDQAGKQLNSIADWPMPRQQATKSIILIPGHRIDIKTGTSGTSQTGSLNYKGENRTIESIGTEQTAKVFEKVLTQKGFKLIPAPPLPSARGDQARRDYQTEVAKLEKEKNAYALELHFDSPKGGKPGVIPGGQYDSSGKYLNQMDVSLASKFGAFSYFWGVGGKDVRQNPNEHLGAVDKGITILELDKLDAKLTKLIEQGAKTGDFTGFEKAITPYAINAAEGLMLAFTPSAKQSSPAPKLPNLPNLDPRIDTKFLQDVSKIAQSVGANPEDLLKVMLYETGGTLSPSKRNSRTKATGLIQFMPATAKGLGTNIDALSQMTPQEQLFFVQKYLKQNSRGQKLDSFREVLSTVFAGNPNASLDVGDGDITLRNYLKKAEDRYGNIARQLTQIVIEGKAIDPDSMQGAVAQAGRLKLNTAAQQYQTNQINSNLSPEQIKDSELNQRLGAYRFIMSSRKTALGDISGTKDSTLGTRRTVLEGLFPNMSNAGRFWIQFENLRRKLEKDAEALQQIIEDTDGAIAQKPDLQAAFNLALKKFPNDPKLVADAIQTNDLSFRATAFKNAQARNDLSFLQSNTDGILQASIEDFDKKELFRFKEQSISEQTKVIEQLQQQLQLVRELKEIDPLNPLVLSIPALQRDIDLLSLNRDQYQQLLDLQRRYYDGGGKGGNMSEKAFQKEFRAILNVNSVKKEGTKLNFNYADTIEKIEQATKKLTKAQTLQSSQADAVKIRSDRFRLQNKETGLVDIQGIKDQFALDSESADIAFQKLVLENSGNFTLKRKERLLKTLRDYRNFVERQSLSIAEHINELEEGELKNQQVMINKAFAEREAGIKYDSRSSNIENLKSDYANPFYVNSLKRGLESEKLELEYDKSLAELNNRLKTESLGGIVRPEGYAASLRTDLLNNYLEKLKQVNKESKDFDSTIKDIAQQQLTSLSSGLTEVIMGTERLGDVLNSIANAFLSGALNALFSSWFSGKGGAGGGLLDLFSSGFSGEGDAGSPLDFNKGGVVPNYADGGVIGAIGDALQRERQASGVKPVLAALTPGERVLTVRQNKRFEELQMEKVLNYAGGGVVGSTSTPNMNFTAPSQSSTVNINVPVNVQGGQGDTSVNVPQLQNAIRSAVLSEIQKQQRPGGALGR